MLNTFDLYDLHAILTNIRNAPSYQYNHEIILKIINVLNDKDNNHDLNQFRTSLKSIVSLDKTCYSFIFVSNSYPYIPMFIKDNKIYELLNEAFQILLNEIDNKNFEKVQDLVESLHNLPIILAENKLILPNNFWKCDIEVFRKKWDKNFLKNIQIKIK